MIKFKLVIFDLRVIKMRKQKIRKEGVCGDSEACHYIYQGVKYGKYVALLVYQQGLRYRGGGWVDTPQKLQRVGKKFHAVGKECKVSDKNVATIKPHFNLQHNGGASNGYFGI